MKKLLSIIITMVLLSSVLLITNTAVSCTICGEEEKFDCNKWSTNDTMVSLNKSTWPLLDKTASVNAFLVNRNCVKPHCDCVCNEENLCHCADTEDSYTSLCTQHPDKCCCCIKPGILTHRGTRGLGVLTGSNDDEIDAIGSYEGIVVKFNEPVLIKQIQIRSLYKEKYNGQDVTEQCDILALEGCRIVKKSHATGTELIGTGNGVVNITNIASSVTDTVDTLIFFVNPFREYARYSDFALAKILTNNGNISFVQPLEGVDCTNQYPVANDDETTVLENSEGNQIDVLDNDYDPDGDKLTIASIDTPSNGEAKIKDGFIEYTPNKDFSGVDSFRYKIIDGHGGEDDACVKILVEDVNKPPVAEDDYISIPEDSNGVTIDVLANDSDPDGDSIYLSHVGDPSHGIISVLSEKILYIPESDYNGDDSFEYEICDGNDEFDRATVHITINPINDQPEVNDIPDQTVDEGESFVSIHLDDYVSDVEDSDSDIEWTFSGNSELIVNIVDHVATITTPDDEWNGQETITFTATDTGGLSDSDDVTFTVNGVNDAPIVEDIPDQTILEGETFSSFDLDDYVSDVEDSDENLQWSYTGNSDLIVNIDEDHVVTVMVPNVNWYGSETITFTVTDTGGLSDSDDASFTVEFVNDAPIANDDSAEVDEDSSVLIDVLANDSDVEDGVPMLSEITVQPEHGIAVIESGMVNYTPDPDFFGTDSFTYKVNDFGGLTDTATVNIHVLGVNDAPVGNDDFILVEEEGTVDVLVGGADSVLDNDSDVDGDMLSVQLTCAPSYATVFELFEDGTFVYTHDGSEYLTDIFSYTVFDEHGGNDTATVTVTIIPKNDAPIANDDSAEVDEDSSVLIDVLANDSDVEDGVPMLSEITVQPEHGTAVIEAGMVNYTPNPDFFGTDTFIYKVEDTENLNDTATVTIHIININDAPEANNDYMVVQEGGTVDVLVGGADSVLDNDSDVDGDMLSVQLTCAPSYATVFELFEDGTFVYTHDGSEYLTDIFSYTVFDEHGGNDTATVTVTIEHEEDNEEDEDEDENEGDNNNGGGGNSRPKRPSSYNNKPNAVITPSETIHILTGEEIELSGSQSSDDGSIENYTWNLDDETEKYGETITHSFTKTNTYTVTLTVKDNLGKTDTDSVKIVVSEPNHPPNMPTIKINGLPAQDEIETTEGKDNNFEIISTDEDGDQIKYIINWGDENTEHSELMDSGEALAALHNWSEPGEYKIKIQAMDDQNAPSEIVTIDLTVKENKNQIGKQPDDVDDDEEQTPDDDKKDKQTGTFPWWLLFLIILIAIIIGLIIYFWWKKPNYIPQVIQPT